MTPLLRRRRMRQYSSNPDFRLVAGRLLSVPARPLPRPDIRVRGRRPGAWRHRHKALRPRVFVWILFHYGPCRRLPAVNSYACADGNGRFEAAVAACFDALVGTNRISLASSGTSSPLARKYSLQIDENLDPVIRIADRP